MNVRSKHDFALKMSNSGEISSEKTCVPSEELSPAKDQLQRCLQSLKGAPNDNEKMACLLLFIHLMKNNNSLTVDSTEVFQAIGPRFIVRLLNSKNVPDGCPVFMYKSLGLNILASFSDKEILFHPLIVSNLSTLVEALSVCEDTADTPELYEDCIKILLTFSRTKDGCKYLLDNNCIPAISQAVLKDPQRDSLFEVLKGILLHLPNETWGGSTSELSDLLELLSRRFAEYQDLKKFSICEKLLVILSSLCECTGEGQEIKMQVASGLTWSESIRKGLREVLQSRCKITYKYSALQLASSVVELLGIDWTLETEQVLLELSNTKFWFLLLSIIKTELKMILESGNTSEAQEKSATVVACYRIIEKTIEFLIADKHGSWSLSDELVLQMHAILVQSFDCIIHFLIHLSVSVDNKPEESSCSFRMPIVMATVRVLCAWLSEETNALSEAVSKVLPILIDWAKRSLEEGSGVPTTNLDCQAPDEIISYLLPPLCHLSADESFCSILVEKEVHILLAKYFAQLWQKQQKEDQEYPSSLITLCNVFLNFSVLEVELLKNNDVFQDILNNIMVSLPNVVKSSSIILLAHFTLLGLLLFRHRCPSDCTNLSTVETSFLVGVIDFLKQAQVVLCGGTEESKVSLEKEWSNISELWFLSVQNLLACAKVIEPVKKVLVTSGWIEETKLWLDKCGNGSEKVTAELKLALIPIANLY